VNYDATYHWSGPHIFTQFTQLTADIATHSLAKKAIFANTKHERKQNETYCGEVTGFNSLTDHKNSHKTYFLVTLYYKVH